MNLSCLGVSFRTAPLEVRERLAYSPAAAAGLLRSVGAALPRVEVLLLSTCNRTELYVAEAGDGAAERLLDMLCEERSDGSVLRDECVRYRLDGVQAARHLLEVTCGLDSAILGDAHILGQIKQALRISAEAGTAGPFLDRVAVHAVRAAKRARSETAIGRGASSIGAAVAAVVAEAGGPILVLGAGEVARDVARHLRKRGLGPLRFANRTSARAQELARECGGTAIEWPALDAALGDAAVIVAATASPVPVVDRAALEAIAARRAQGPPLVVDLGVPRNVEPASGVAVVDVDAIRDRRDAATRARQAAVPAVKEIIEREIAAWARWCRTRAIDDLVRTLYRDVEAHSSEAGGLLADRYGVSAGDAARFVRRCVRPLVHEHVRRLRQVVSADLAASLA